MTKKEQFVVKAEKELTGKDEDIGKFFCRICSKLYTSEKVAANHLHKEHQAVIDGAVISFEQQDKDRMMKFGLDRIEKFFVDSEKEWAEIQEKFLEGFKINPANTLQWNTENVIKAQEHYRIVMEIQAAKKRLAAETGDWLPSFKDYLDEFADDLKESIIRSPYRHNSTSALSNIQAAVELEAKTDFFNTFSLYGISGLKQCVKMAMGVE